MDELWEAEKKLTKKTITGSVKHEQRVYGNGIIFILKTEVFRTGSARPHEKRDRWERM